MHLKNSKLEKSIAQKSQDGAVKVGEINKRAEFTKENVKTSQKKALEISSSTRDKLEQAIENSKIVKKIDLLLESIMQITAHPQMWIGIIGLCLILLINIVKMLNSLIVL
jgi:hypothetical protein